MIVETSALVAVVTAEPDADRYYEVMRSAAWSQLSAASYLEAAIVVDSRGNPVMSRRLDALLESLDASVVAVSEAQARIARQAYRDFGKGSGHRAQLNFGDCFAYALATETDEPLLFKSDDFGPTGVRSAL
ncbi:MAG: type II toxin-antitoxin system VapC family toxin [Jatrophihabitans sp.]